MVDFCPPLGCAFQNLAFLPGLLEVVPKAPGSQFLGLSAKGENESLPISLGISLVQADEFGLHHVVF